MFLEAEFTVEDIREFDSDTDERQLQTLLEEAIARAVTAVPALGLELTKTQFVSARSILRTAILRALDLESGVISQQSQSLGPYSESVSYSQSSPKTLFWPSELRELESIVSGESTRRRARSIAPYIAPRPSPDFWS